MKKASAAFAATFITGVFSTAAIAGTACPANNGSVPADGNTTDRTAPFFIDTSGLNLKTSPPTRDPADPLYPRATALPDGVIPAPTGDGNFIISASHPPAADTIARAVVPKGSIHSFTMSSTDSTFYRPGMIRDDQPGCGNSAVNTAATAPGDPSNMIVTASHAGSWTRTVDVYVPAGYEAGTKAPFMVLGDGGPTGFFDEKQFFTVLDNLIAADRIPPIIAISIGSGGQDAQGAERGREYDAVSGTYAEWVEHEVLPLVESNAQVQLASDPDDRATMGISSSGVAAFTMAWFHPELYHRVLAYSPTMVNQQWPHDTALPGGAWEYHDAWTGPKKPNLTVNGIKVTPSAVSPGAPLIPNSPAKPIRYWFEVGDHDLFYPVAAMADGMHDWVLANERMAAVLAAKNYHYQFIFAHNAGHVDNATVAETLPEALEYVWSGYKAQP